MDIDSLSEQVETTCTLDAADETVSWNGRDIQELEGRSPFAGFLAVRQDAPHGSLHARRIQIKPNMARPPDESQASLEGGYDEKRGAFVEGKWTWTWKSTESSSEKNEEPTRADPPDARDRDFDKDGDRN